MGQKNGAVANSVDVDVPRHKPPRTRAADRKVYGRTKVGNGSALLPPQPSEGRLLPAVDSRSLWVRRCKDVIAQHLNDLGGADNASAAEQSIIRRASVMTVELEQLEQKFALAGHSSASELDLYVRASGNLRRLLEAVGLERRAKQVTTKSVQEIIAEVNSENNNAVVAD